MQTCDEVFSYANALAVDKAQIGLGRIYRQWKKSHAGLDPSFDAHQYRLENE